jgi:hypothetical protein
LTTTHGEVIAVEFYSTAAQVIPILLVVAALQSRLLSWAAHKYRKGGWERRKGQLVLFSIGGSLISEAITLVVLMVNKDWLTSCGWIRGSPPTPAAAR